MAHISSALRREVANRARRRCEYCQTARILVEDLEIDHIIPEARGGKTVLENLCFACRRCNGRKRIHKTGFDPLTHVEVALFNPREQRWSDHFEWSDDGLRVIGLTPVGRATVQLLKMNSPSIAGARRLWVQAGWHPPKKE